MNDGWPRIENMSFMDAGPFTWQGVPVRVSRSGYTGEDGFEISIPAEDVAGFADALCAEPEVKPIGLGARDSLRLEAGLPLYGHDMSPDTSPIEAGLTFGINKRRKAEGGFPGAPRIQRELADGPAKKLVGFSVEGRMPVREGAIIYSDEAQVGRITSGGFAPTVGAPIAMGYVDTQYSAPGTPLDAEVRGKRVPLTVAEMPFVPHRYHRKGAAK